LANKDAITTGRSAVILIASLERVTKGN